MFNWLRNIFKVNEEDRKLIELFKEYDVEVCHRGLSKTSKPEYREKHRREHNKIARDLR